MADSLLHYYLRWRIVYYIIIKDGGDFTKKNIFQDGGGWESKHGGLLGIKYVLAVRPDLASILLPRVYPAVQTCKI